MAAVSLMGATVDIQSPKTDASIAALLTCASPCADDRQFMHRAYCDCASPNDHASASSSFLPPAALAESMWCAKERQECKEHCQGDEINFGCSDTFGGWQQRPIHPLLQQVACLAADEIGGFSASPCGDHLMLNSILP